MDVVPVVQKDASATNLKPKPAVPKKPVKLTSEYDVTRTTHVKEMIRKLQEKEQLNGSVKLAPLKMGGKPGKTPTVPEKEETTNQESNQTLEDLKAIDEDIEKLRKQIEERDKIISALREAAEAKDKKLDNLMMEYSKLKSNGKLELDTEANRSASSSPSSPPLCNGELCWTDSFVNKNYHEPVYAQLLNDHAALQKVYEELRSKLESKNEVPGAPKTTEGGENAINLIMAEQIRALKEREAQLIWEAEELREQNDLMEFRILELEECRKEFLDKEGKHRTEKIVWRERDIEEVSDSGVMSLPTSEDLTSDSELGEAIRNYSPLGAVTHLSLSTSEITQSDPGDLKLKKSLKTSECLQESGIFVDTEAPSECPISSTLTKSSQTESVLEKTLLDIIDNSCDLFLSKNPGYLEEPDPKSDDLTTEISKLSVIQKKIQQQKTHTPPSPRSPHTVASCPHSNGLLFYEERLAQLEDKLKIYESSGDAKDELLAKRLQKEVELAHRVKELTDKVVSLEATKRKLEEEKCEFEEAENDTRFQCQRLEIKLQELIDKNAELELEIERQKVMMNEEKRRTKKKSNLEGLLSKYEQRNYEMIEKDVEARQKLNMIEAAMPAIVAYNVFKMVQNPDLSTSLSDTKESFEEEELSQKDSRLMLKLKEAYSGEKSLDEETTEEKLKQKIQEMEEKAAKDREILEEMTSTLKMYKVEEKPSKQDEKTYKTEREIDLFEELKNMAANEVELRRQIELLEKKEEAYMQSLDKADEIWADMEAGYKRRLAEAEKMNETLQHRITQLEAAQVALEKSLAEQSQISSSDENFHTKIQELIIENKKLKAEFSLTLKEKFEEHRKFLEAENLSLREEVKKLEVDSAREEAKYKLLLKEMEMERQELRHEKGLREVLQKELEEKSQGITSVELNLQSQISRLTQELNQKSKELSSLEVTVAELREEVDTLEKKVGELVKTIQSKMSQEEASGRSVAPREASAQSSPPVPLHPVRLDTPSKPFEILPKTEVSLPNIQVLIPSEFYFRYLVFAFPTYFRQEAKCSLPSSKSALSIYQRISEGRSQTAILDVKRKSELEMREDDIFQLSIKNTELQQTLERIEEESKSKDKELEELQRIALEIQKEQRNLTMLYRKMSRDEGTNQDGTSGFELQPKQIPRKNSSIEVLQVINPVVFNNSEKISTSFSSLQIAIDNLQSKYRSKAIKIQPLLNELKQKGDSRDFEDFLKLNLVDFPSEDDTKEENWGKLPRTASDVEEDSAKSPRSSMPSISGSSDGSFAPPVGSAPKRLLLKPADVDPDLSYAPRINTVRKVGDDGVFLEWDVSSQPPAVTGFEIRVNGVLHQKVRSSTRNKALLHQLNLKQPIAIHLNATSELGRSTKSSHAIYPNDHFL